MPKKKKVYCLYRVSTKGQVEKDDIPMQKDYCRDFAKEQGWEIIQELSEKGVSGFKVSAKDRDAIQEIQKDAALHKFDVLLVFMFDRLGRHEDETPFVVEWFVKNGIEVWSAKEGQQRFDTHVDKLTNYIRYWQASGESIKTSIRTKTRLAQIVQEGRFRGGKAPFGYQLEKKGRINKKNHEVYEIAVNEQEAEVVRLIFQKYVREGYGAQRLAHFLSDEGIHTRKGVGFVNTSINTILKNIIYIGVLRSGESQSEIFPELQIIDEDTFQQAQEIMKQRTQEHSSVPRNNKSRALVSGLIYCGHCGHKMVLSTSGKNYTRADGTIVENVRLRYQCHNQVRHPDLCDGQNTYRAERVDALVAESIRRLFVYIKTISEKEVIQAQVHRQELFCRSQLEQANRLLDSKSKELSDYQSEVLKVIRGESPLKMDIINGLVEQAEEAVKQAKANAARWQEELSNVQTKGAEIHKFYGRVVNWSELFDKCSIAEKKMIVSQLIQKVSIHKDYSLDIDFNISVHQILDYNKPSKSA